MEDYFPVYLWSVYHRKRGNNLFWELLKVVANRIKIDDVQLPESDTLPDPEINNDVNVESVPDKVIVTKEKMPCLYCGNKYIGLGGIKRHLVYCQSKKDKRRKVVESAVTDDLEERIPCLYCTSEFPQSVLASHLATC